MKTQTTANTKAQPGLTRELTKAETRQISGGAMMSDPGSMPRAPKGLDFTSAPGTWTPSHDGGTYHA